MRSDIIWVPELAAQGVLLNLTKQPWFQPIKKDALPGPLSTNYYQGSYYGMPADTNTQVLFWNKADFAAAGLSGPPTTISQLWADAQEADHQVEGPVRPRRRRHGHLERSPVHLEQRWLIYEPELHDDDRVHERRRHRVDPPGNAQPAKGR